MFCQHISNVNIINITNMEGQVASRQINKCSECDKKSLLIQKYLNLIQLLKKKSDRSNLSSTFKKSLDAGTTSNTSLLNPFKYQKIMLPILLKQMLNRQREKAFSVMRNQYVVSNCRKAYKMVSILQKIIQGRIYSFCKLLLPSNKKREIIVQSHALNFEQNAKTPNQKSLNNTNPICSVTCFVEAEKKQKLKTMARKVFQLEKQLQKMKYQKKILDIQVQENYRRQQVQSKKKKESLQMLAEEMNEKNQIISQLQSSLKFYQQKFGKFENNILQQDGLQMRNQIERLQKVVEKLNVQIQKKNQQLQKYVNQSKMNSQKMIKIESQYVELKQKNFQICMEMQSMSRKKKECNQLGAFLQKKLLNIRKYQKIISNNMKMIEQCSISERSSFNSSLKGRKGRQEFQVELASQNNINNMNNQASNIRQTSPVSTFQNQYKIQKILNYLYNIDSQDSQLNNVQKLFDNQEYNVLVQVKRKFTQLQNIMKNQKREKTQLMNRQQNADQIKVPSRQTKECGDNDEIYFNQHHVSGSIFDVFASEKGHKDKQSGTILNGFDQQGVRQSHQSNSSGTNRKMDQGFTIKLLQMEIDKNKQIQKISQLKNKLFHIRSIVMNLIKSLQIKLLKPQTKDIVDLCCQFFEFSQEEKDTIFHMLRKQKKFLGWF